MDNITTNIVKYADPSFPVVISSSEDKGMTGFAFENKVLAINEKIESTGIGIQSIKNMMQKMGGKCIVEKSEEKFRVVLLFPCLQRKMADVQLIPLEREDRKQFILDNQEAFRYGAMEEFGLRDDHFEEDGEIISRDTIETSIDSGTAYRISQNGEKVGGLVVKVEGNRGDLELLFVAPKVHSKGILLWM